MSLLCQSGGCKARNRLRDKLTGKNKAPLRGQQIMQLLHAVYHLPPACDQLLQALLCQRCCSEECSSDVLAGRLKLLREYAHACVGYAKGSSTQAL